MPLEKDTEKFMWISFFRNIITINKPALHMTTTDRPLQLLYAYTFDFLTENRKLNLKNVISGNSNAPKRQNDEID